MRTIMMTNIISRKMNPSYGGLDLNLYMIQELF